MCTELSKLAPEIMCLFVYPKWIKTYQLFRLAQTRVSACIPMHGEYWNKIMWHLRSTFVRIWHHLCGFLSGQVRWLISSDTLGEDKVYSSIFVREKQCCSGSLHWLFYIFLCCRIRVCLHWRHLHPPSPWRPLRWWRHQWHMRQWFLTGSTGYKTPGGPGIHSAKKILTNWRKRIVLVQYIQQWHGALIGGGIARNDRSLQ